LRHLTEIKVAASQNTTITFLLWSSALKFMNPEHMHSGSGR